MQRGQAGNTRYYDRGRPHQGRGGYYGWDRGYGQRDIMEELLPDRPHTLEIPQLFDGEPDAAISNVRYLASYNYVLSDDGLDMIVPGTICIR